jgi:hypothetical protein
MKYSYELAARYVMPKFQGSTASLDMSFNFFKGMKGALAEERENALQGAIQSYEEERTTWKR